MVFLLRYERREAYRIILLFGVISLLGDIIYEGARGIIAPYVRSLGASPEIVSLVTNFKKNIERSSFTTLSITINV